MGTGTRSEAGRYAWLEYHRRLLPVAIFGIFLILACFSFVALVVNGQLGFFRNAIAFRLLGEHLRVLKQEPGGDQ